jgi:hypothetical protein
VDARARAGVPSVFPRASLPSSRGERSPEGLSWHAGPGSTLELREDKLEQREQAVAALEERLAKKESDFAAYVRELQAKFKRREAEWWSRERVFRPGPAPPSDRERKNRPEA